MNHVKHLNMFCILITHKLHSNTFDARNTSWTDKLCYS